MDGQITLASRFICTRLSTETSSRQWLVFGRFRDLFRGNLECAESRLHCGLNAPTFRGVRRRAGPPTPCAPSPLSCAVTACVRPLRRRLRQFRAAAAVSGAQRLCPQPCAGVGTLQPLRSPESAAQCSRRRRCVSVERFSAVFRGVHTPESELFWRLCVVCTHCCCVPRNFLCFRPLFESKSAKNDASRSPFPSPFRLCCACFRDFEWVFRRSAQRRVSPACSCGNPPLCTFLYLCVCCVFCVLFLFPAHRCVPNISLHHSVGICGKFGTRYGASLRKLMKKIEVSSHSKVRVGEVVCGCVCVFESSHVCLLCVFAALQYQCVFCGRTAVQRACVGIWECRGCRKVFAGGAYQLG